MEHSPCVSHGTSALAQRAVESQNLAPNPELMLRARPAADPSGSNEMLGKRRNTIARSATKPRPAHDNARRGRDSKLQQADGGTHQSKQPHSVEQHSGGATRMGNVQTALTVWHDNYAQNQHDGAKCNKSQQTKHARTRRSRNSQLQPSGVRKQP